MLPIRYKGFVWLWIAALLTATIGISVERIYCYCLGKTSFALATLPERESDCCAAKKRQRSSCCAGETMPSGSCASTAPDELGQAGFHDAGCTHKTIRVLQLHAEYLLEKHHNFELEFPLWFREVPFFKQLTRPVLCQSAALPRYSKPPPVSGRMRCVQHQLYRC